MSGPHKKGGHEDGGGHAPMWIVSFADMVILLMSFFVLLLCQATQKKSTDDDLLKIIASVKMRFGYTPRPDSKDPLDLAVLQMLSQKRTGGFTHSGSMWKDAAVTGEPSKSKNQWVKAQSNISLPIRFARDSAVIPSSMNSAMEEAAAVVRHQFRSVVIQGHCSQEEAVSDSKGGDELSFRRAFAVKLALQNLGIAASRLRIVTCGPHESLKQLNSTDRQLACVTIGSYFLPTDSDVLSEGSIKKDTGAAKPPTDHH